MREETRVVFLPAQEEYRFAGKTLVPDRLGSLSGCRVVSEGVATENSSKRPLRATIHLDDALRPHEDDKALLLEVRLGAALFGAMVKGETPEGDALANYCRALQYDLPHTEKNSLSLHDHASAQKVRSHREAIKVAVCRCLGIQANSGGVQALRALIHP